MNMQFGDSTRTRCSPSIKTGVPLILAFALFAAACGGSDAADGKTDTDGAEDVTATEVTTDAGEGDEEETATTGAVTTEAGDTTEEPASTDCSAGQRGDGPYLVTNIPAGDADGGLVMRVAPGSDQDRVEVLPTDQQVYVYDALGCSLVGSDVWWEVDLGEAFTGWVNSSFLGGYDGPGDRVAIGTTEALCDAYNVVLSGQETDIYVAGALIMLDVELGGQPVGVSGAIADLLNGTGDAQSLESIRGYVGPICASTTPAGIDYDNETLGTTAQACLNGVAAACDTIQGYTMSPEGALARAFVEAVMSNDQATIAQLADQSVVDSMWVIEEPAQEGFGLESIQISDTGFSFDPFPTGATTCTITGAFVSNCIYAP